MRGSANASEQSGRRGDSRWTRTAGTLAVFVLVASPGAALAFQETVPGANTPVAVQPAATTAPTQPAVAAQQQSTQTAEFPVGAPHLQAIAQGLVTIDGPVVWRVREDSLSAAARQETGPPSFTLQRTGASIIRNDLSTRRLRLEPGEAAFSAGGDPFSKSATGTDPSIIWVEELLPQAAAAAAGTGTTLFTSDPVSDYPPGTYDFELQRGVLLPGEVSEIPAHTGAALIMVTAGRVQVSSVGSPPTPAGAGSGVLAPGAITLRNGDTQPAAFTVAMLGDAVDGSEGASAGQAAAGATAPTQTPLLQTPVAPGATMTPSVLPTLAPVEQTQPVATEITAPVVDESAALPSPTPATQAQSASGDTDGDGLSDVDEANSGSDPLNKDYDGDGLLDGEEVYQYGSDPLNNDTDGDGLLDGDEVNQYGTSPATTDTDGDGLTDPDEIFTYATSPGALDTDGDGIPDGEEILNDGTDPFDPSSRRQ